MEYAGPVNRNLASFLEVDKIYIVTSNTTHVVSMSIPRTVSHPLTGDLHKISSRYALYWNTCPPEQIGGGEGGNHARVTDISGATIERHLNKVQDQTRSDH